MSYRTTEAVDRLLADPDGIHAAAIAALPPITPETAARIRALAQSAEATR